MRVPAMMRASLITALLPVSTALAQTPAPAAAPAAPATKPAGHWTGSVHMGAQDVPITVDLSKNASGAWVGTFSVPGSPQSDIPLVGIAIDATTMKFSVDVGDRATFDARFVGDGNGLTGTASNSQGSTGFDMTLSADAPKVNLPAASTAFPKSFEGKWDGTINIGGQALRLSMTLATGTDGNATAALVSPDQSAMAFNASTVTASGNDLTVELRAIGATYKGTVAGDTITGSWSQGPVSAPLSFKKAP